MLPFSVLSCSTRDLGTQDKTCNALDQSGYRLRFYHLAERAACTEFLAIVLTRLAFPAANLPESGIPLVPKRPDHIQSEYAASQRYGRTRDTPHN
jgi:hypothetical protein